MMLYSVTHHLTFPTSNTLKHRGGSMSLSFLDPVSVEFVILYAEILYAF